ncbi:acetoacetate--CoA ligase [Embleya sp. NPDC005971]|uniref:acetoacetate--CoA ligase n=1 Tax=Embleya sp. NPDC005971 TaxID=3156724 RepID=UPI0033DA1081
MTLDRYPEPTTARPSPDRESVEAANITAFARWLTAEGYAEPMSDYRSLQTWSTEHLPEFWAAVWAWFDIRAASVGAEVLTDDPMPYARWFPGATLNYVDHVFRYATPDTPAVVEAGEPGPDHGGTAVRRELSWAELRRQVAAVAATLHGLGVGRGDRVVGYLPDIAETVIAFLATASLGATWSVCGQDYAPTAARDRFAQLDPVVLVTADGYRHGGRTQDRRSAVARLRAGLPNLRATIVVERLADSGEAADPADRPVSEQTLTWAEASAGEHVLRPVAVPFEHPLWILFSSGTTGLPKGIVHGHGGVLLEHLKTLSLHFDLRPGDRFLWYTTPSWMMWNLKVSALLTGATTVCHDGSPTRPSADGLWAVAADLGVTVLGTSPAYLLACARADTRPGIDHDLSRLRLLGSTGAILPASAHHWVAEHVSPRVRVVSTTGGTDVVTGFAGGVPTVPVRAGEISAPCLGVALAAWDGSGQAVLDRPGELVITKPMPSMPVSFWADPDGSRYHRAYFATHPGVWTHGDRITVTAHGGILVHGRSDATLNRNGVRMGSADIYQAVEALPEIVEALVVGVDGPDGAYWMPLFVTLAAGARLDSALRARIHAVIRDEVSSRHLPDDIHAVPGIPHTRTGKKLEIPIKRILQGTPIDEAVDPAGVDEPTLLAWYLGLAGRHTGHPDTD